MASLADDLASVYQLYASFGAAGRPSFRSREFMKLVHTPHALRRLHCAHQRDIVTL